MKPFHGGRATRRQRMYIVIVGAGNIGTPLVEIASARATRW
jgi:hypothetical protein